MHTKYAYGNNEKVDNYDTSEKCTSTIPYDTIEKCTSTIPYDRHKNQVTDDLGKGVMILLGYIPYVST